MASPQIGKLISLERAAEIVSTLRVLHNEKKLEGMEHIDLFCHFDDIFRLSERDKSGKLITRFAELCGFPVASDVHIEGVD